MGLCVLNRIPSYFTVFSCHCCDILRAHKALFFASLFFFCCYCVICCWSLFNALSYFPIAFYFTLPVYAYLTFAKQFHAIYFSIKLNGTLLLLLAITCIIETYLFEYDMVSLCFKDHPGKLRYKIKEREREVSRKNRKRKCLEKFKRNGGLLRIAQKFCDCLNDIIQVIAFPFWLNIFAQQVGIDPKHLHTKNVESTNCNESV